MNINSSTGPLSTFASQASTAPNATRAEALLSRQLIAQQSLPTPSDSNSEFPHDSLELTDEALESSEGREALRKSGPKSESLRDVFQDFVGQTFFTELLKSLRSTQDGAKYFNGGRAEEIFQGQLDQVLTEHLSDASAKTISDPMFKLFQLKRGAS